MRIGLLTAHLSRTSGGVWPAVRGLAHSLFDQQRCDVAVFGLADDTTEVSLRSWCGPRVQAYDVVGPHAFGFAPGLARAVFGASLDLLHVHGLWMYPSVVSLGWARRVNRPYVVSPHGMLEAWAIRRARWKKSMAGLLFEQEHLAGAKCLHAVSEGEVNGIRRYGLRNAICVVPVGVDLPQLENMKPASPWEGIIDSGRKVLLYLGRLHPVKGLRHLLLAISRAVSDNPQLASNWAIAIAGWGENDYENELRELVRDLGVEESVKFLGPLYDEKKSAAYAHAHAFVLPSHSEGLPVTVLEAWAHGLPVLMTAACNLHEGFSAGAAVEITPTPEGVFAGLKEIFSMAGPELLEMGSRGRQLVEQRFAWAKCAREMYKVYDWLLGGSARPDCVLPKQ